MGWFLTRGISRFAACGQLGLTDVRVIVREHEGSTADSAAENVTRKQLTPLEEARAAQAMLDESYTTDGAAQALGWSAPRVAARAKIRVAVSLHRILMVAAGIFTRPGRGGVDSARMDLISLALGLIFFAMMLALLEGIDRV